MILLLIRYIFCIYYLYWFQRIFSLVDPCPSGTYHRKTYSVIRFLFVSILSLSLSFGPPVTTGGSPDLPSVSHRHAAQPKGSRLCDWQWIMVQWVSIMLSRCNRVIILSLPLSSSYFTFGFLFLLYLYEHYYLMICLYFYDDMFILNSLILLRSPYNLIGNFSLIATSLIDDTTGRIRKPSFSFIPSEISSAMPGQTQRYPIFKRNKTWKVGSSHRWTEVMVIVWLIASHVIIRQSMHLLVRPISYLIVRPHFINLLSILLLIILFLQVHIICLSFISFISYNYYLPLE